MNKKLIKKKYREVLRFFLNRSNRSKLNNEKFTVISANCIGGVVLHELGLQFLTPTINLYFDVSDFVKFCKKIQCYLSCELEEIDSTENYPCAKCDDIIIHFVHYSSFKEANETWNKRKQRINYKNLYFIMADRDGCTEKDRLDFDQLPYLNKAFLTYKKRDNIKCAVSLIGTQDGDKDQIIDITQYKGKFTGRRFVDDWDYVSYFNSRELK